MALTVAQLSQAVGLTVTGSPEPPHLAIVTRQLAVAEHRIELYAPDAPPDVKDEAAIRLVGYLLDAPPYPRSTYAPADAFRASGARELLAAWHEPAAATVT